jgi:hypothetical protein
MSEKLGFLFQPIAQERHDRTCWSWRGEETSVTNELSENSLPFLSGKRNLLSNCGWRRVWLHRVPGGGSFLSLGRVDFLAVPFR